MRVALVCPYAWAVPGGVQSHVAGLAAALRARGHDVDVIAPLRGVPIRDNGSVQRVALSPRAAVGVARLVQAYDLVHLHEPMIPAICLSALATSRAPLVGTFHMVAPTRRWYRVFGPLAQTLLPRLRARIAVSEAARAYVAAACPGHYEVIPNGIDVASFAEVEPEREGRRIVFVGRAEPRKGLGVLLEAFRRLPGEPLLDLVGIWAVEIRAAGPRVRAHGHVADSVRRRLLAHADILCAPSLRSESFGLVLAEGMAAGLPVVASALPAYTDVLPPACGRLVPPGDPAPLAAALAELLADAPLRERLGAAGRVHARRYDWSHVAERVLDMYRQAVSSQHSLTEAQRRVKTAWI